ncbi:MAG: PASTA domain-containing protein [Ruminococcaceae bacterium]|nr:PASTA domain-containing protein [Oscillospiraceae bacterium]
MKSKPNKIMLKRMFIVLLCVVITTISVLGYRLTLLMLVRGEKYQGMASEQQLYDSLITAPRGNIYDKNMNVLATSTTAWTVYITPNGIFNISDSAKQEKVRNIIADGLSEILGVDREEVYEDTGKRSYYVIVKKKVDKETSDKVREFITANKEYQLTKYIGLDESTKRYYPNNNLASVVLGFVGDDDQGLAGIESYYDTTLTGEPGRVVAAKTAQGIDMPFTYEMVEEATQGDSLVLTIDNYIQYVCEKQLKQAVEDNKCNERGVAMVMNVKTGEILAMAVSGDFNPNEPFTLSASDQKIVDALEGDERAAKLSELRNRQWRNKAVSDAYEPGSVFKIFTAAAALEENAVTLDSSFSCVGHTQVAGQPYHCHKRAGHGLQTLITSMSNSCNPAFITIGQMMGVSTFSKYFEAFGFTSKTGIDIPGETTSIYYSKDTMGPVELASASFGQTFKITPVQLISAAAAAVNGGYLVQPHVVSKVLDSEGNVKENKSVGYRRQVISKETSDKLRVCLEAVVNGGAKNAYVAGYKTGGKTGTSQKIDKINQTKKSSLYVASYVGLAPIDDPEIAILVLLDEPTAGSIYGGTISAPVASAILSEILPYMGFEPQYSAEELAKRAIAVPSVAGKSVAEAKTRITNSNLIYKVVGNGDTVISQLPASNDTLYAGGLVIIYTDEQSAQSETTSVPSFIGMTVTEVNAAAKSAGVNVKFSGNTLSSANTLAYSQSIKAGETVSTGTSITVYFRDSSVTDFVPEE